MTKGTWSPALRAHVAAVAAALADAGADPVFAAGVVRDLEGQIAEMRTEEGLADADILPRLSAPSSYVDDLPATATDRPAEPPLPSTPPAGPEAAKPVGWAWQWWWATVVLAGFLFIPAYRMIGRWMDYAPATRTSHYGYGYGRLSDTKQLLLGLIMYAGDHDGRYPTELRMLITKDYIPEWRLLASPGDVEPLGQVAGFPVESFTLTLPGAKEKGVAPDTPLLVYPYRTGSGRMAFTVGFADGHARTFRDEAAFLALFNRRDGR